MSMMQMLFAGGNLLAYGGTVTTFGNYRIHTFNSSGTLTVTSAPLNSTVEYLVVAGGGSGGGNFSSGGGGAGGPGSFRPSGGRRYIVDALTVRTWHSAKTSRRRARGPSVSSIGTGPRPTS